jgi:type VI protein secretion system component Hcp
MANDDSTDMLMMFVGANDVMLETDCQTRINLVSTLMKGFTSAENGRRANFFEIDDVDISVDLKPENAYEEPKKWGLDLGDVTIERVIDRASPLLMKAALTPTPFKSATIVKRRSTGGSQTGDAYLRIDYTDVLLTKISWSDGDAVKEKITFIYRKVEVQYRPQDASGKLRAAIQGKYPKAN